MTINFPNSPITGQLYTFGETTWQWSGEYWNVYSAQTGYITSVSSAGSGYTVIESVTSNALTLKSFKGRNLEITDSNGELNFYVPLNGGGGGQLYYFNISKTQTPYYELATSATTEGEQSLSVSVGSGVTNTIGQFLTPSGFPGVLILPGGIWSFFLHAYKQNSSASFNIYCDVYKRTTGGTETLLFSTDPTPILANSPTPLMSLTDTYYSGTTLDVTDRLLINVRVTNTSSNTYSVTFVSEGPLHYSYMSSPLQVKAGDVYVNSFTYTSSANTITIGQTEGYTPQSINLTTFSGLTITSGLTVNTISATTYQNLPVFSYYQNTVPTGTGTGIIITGSTWEHSDTGIQYIYIYDGDSYQWIQQTLPQGTGPIGPTGPNNISTGTTTDIVGILRGNGVNVSAATPNVDYQSALGFTPENVTNKETVALDGSNTKYPTNNVVNTALQSFSDDVDYAIMINQRILFNF